MRNCVILQKKKNKDHTGFTTAEIEQQAKLLEKQTWRSWKEMEREMKIPTRHVGLYDGHPIRKVHETGFGCVNGKKIDD